MSPQDKIGRKPFNPDRRCHVRPCFPHCISLCTPRPPTSFPHRAGWRNVELSPSGLTATAGPTSGSTAASAALAAKSATSRTLPTASTGATPAFLASPRCSISPTMSTGSSSAAPALPAALCPPTTTTTTTCHTTSQVQLAIARSAQVASASVLQVKVPAVSSVASRTAASGRA